MEIKIGDLAKRTGISVRTLHHYDEIGLLSPSLRTESGHRLYTSEDALRLQQILSLKLFGFSLSQIQQWLQTPEHSPLNALELHLKVLKTELSDKQKTLSQLERIVGVLKKDEEPDVEDLLDLIEDTNMIEKYYSKEQLEQLSKRAQALGDDGMNDVQLKWTVLIEKVRCEMLAGTDPSNERVRALANEWKSLINMFSGGDPEIAASLQRMYEKEGCERASQNAIDKELSDYIAKSF